MKLCIATFFFFSRCLITKSACSPSLLGVQDKLFLLSDDQLDANEAEDRCNEFGANLATICDATIDTALKNAFSKYTADLTRLWFYHQNVASKKPIRASRTQINDPNWISLKGVTDPWFIDFYKESRSSSNLKPLRACTNNEGNWKYSLYECNAVPGEIEQMKVYGSTSAATGFKALYIYRSTVDPYKNANILLSTDEAYGPYIPRQFNFYVPVINRNVFIGAQYSTSNGSWIWSNGSVANYNTHGLKICQQKALHYGSDWELVNKECSGKKESYVCQVNQTLEPFVEHDVCDATNLKIRWNDGFKKLIRKLSNIHLKVEISVPSHTTNMFVNYTQLSANITNLQPRTDYIIKVKTSFQGCANTHTVSTISVKTGYGLPEDITNAWVLPQSGCFVNIPVQHIDYKSMNATHYSIEAKSESNTTIHLIQASHLPMNVSIPTDDHEPNEKINLTIQTLSENCKSPAQTIIGHCWSRSCGPTLMGVKDNLLAIYDDMVDSNTAEKTCLASGGHLATTSDQHMKESLTTMLNKYMTDLQIVWKLYTNTTKTFFYSTTNTPMDNWTIPDDNLKYFYLYRSASFDRKKYFFCQRNDGVETIIQTTPCSGVFGKTTFSFFGGKSSTTGYKTIYQWSDSLSSLLSFENISFAQFNLSREEIYAADPNTDFFIGARFNETSSNWRWSDGSEANFSDSDVITCQQKALHYGKGWEVISKNCTGDKARFVCQVNWLEDPSIEQQSCNSSSVAVRWKRNIHNLSGLLNDTKIKLKVHVIDQNQTSIISYSDLPEAIRNLQPGTNYSLKVRTTFEGCNNATIESSLHFKTQLGVMEPVTNASVILQPGCYVHIPAVLDDSKLMKTTSHQILAKSNSNESIHFFEASQEAINVDVPLKYHGYNERVNLKIKAISENCSTQFHEIRGYCVSPACSPTIFGINDTIYLLSDDVVDANTAGTKCSTMNGMLALMTNQMINETILHYLSKYTNNLQRIWKLHKMEYNLYTYTTSEKTLGAYLRPLDDLLYFDLFKRKLSTDQREYFFCKTRPSSPKTMISLSNCSDDFNNTLFFFFGRSTAAPGYVPLYHYHEGNKWFLSSRLTYIDVPNGTHSSKSSTIFAPVFKVFVGARFMEASKNWVWSDGSTADFNTTGLNTCQQKALQYGNGWKPVNLNCSDDQAYYACQTKFAVSISTFITCNSSVIQVQWTDHLIKLLQNANQMINVKIEVTDNQSSNKVVTVPYSSLQVNIRSLKQESHYSLKATVVFQACSNFSVQTTKTVWTKSGIPKFVAAKVLSSNPCIVNIQRTQTDQLVTHQVTGNGSDHEVTIPSTNDVQASDNYNLTIPMDQWRPGNNVNFNIRLATCSGNSPTVPVIGNCVIPPLTTEQPDASALPTGSIGIPGELGPGAAVGSTIAILILIGLVVAVFFREKRKGNAKNLDLPTVYYNVEGNSNPSSASNERTAENIYENCRVDKIGNWPVRQEQLYPIYLENCSREFVKFRKEFEKICGLDKSEERKSVHASMKRNTGQNRYKNIFPYDHARVILITKPDNDYINAAYMPGYSNQWKFIASQGPKPSTVEDFWLMTWEQETTIIVMLTNLLEGSKTKCEQYWPDLSKSEERGDFVIRSIEENKFGGIVQRKFQLRRGQENRSITQFHYISWPDHGIPVTTSNMIYLRRMVEKIYDNQHPIIVHCSAGAGRTGTYIAMDFLFDQLDAEGKVDVYRCVATMRENRTDMVQNLKQYSFIYKLILEHDTLPESDRGQDEIQSMAQSELAAVIQNEYIVLEDWRFGGKWEKINKSAKTYPNNEISIWSDQDQEIKVLNASKIEDLGSAIAFIAAEIPEAGMEETFWKMILLKQVGVVVCLEEEGNFWTTEETVEYGSVQVTQKTSEEQEAFHVKILSVSSNGKSDPEKITLMHVPGWKNNANPPNKSDLVEIANQVKLLRTDKQKKEVLVCCRNGCSKTGTLIALINILERLKAESKVDVFRTVKDLRDMRPNMVDQEKLYSYCYMVVVEYLSSFGTYVNY